MNSKTMLHKITGVLLEVNIERNETWPDEQDEALAQTVMDLNAEEFTSRQQEIVEEIMAIHGVTRVTVLFTG